MSRRWDWATAEEWIKKDLDDSIEELTRDITYDRTVALRGRIEVLRELLKQPHEDPDKYLTEQVETDDGW